MEDYYEYLDSNGVTTLYKLIKDDTVALIDSYSVTINGITTNLDNHVNNTDIHTPISDIENMVDTKVSGLVNSAPETLDTLKELSDALGNDPNFATTVANQIGNKASKDDVYTKEETDTLLEGKADSVHNHVVKDITDFPTIPTKTSELSNDSNFVTSTELHDYATKNDLNSKQDALSEEQLSNIDSIPDKANKSDLSTVATSGSYKDLLDKPVLPEGADLSDYYNKGETDNLLNSKANTSDLAVVAKSGNYNDLNNTPTIPTKLSQLENDMGFGSGSGGVITSISWTNITDKPNFATVATSGSYNDLSNKPTIPKVYNKTLTIQKNGTNVATFTSNSNTDVTADITVPTKVSELSNDSGFITGISWDKVTNKPTLAKVATSGSYTDLSNTPTIPTKVSQLENDTGFINTLTDVVDTKSNQTINGIKTFTGSPFVSNYATTNGFFTKLNTIARNEVPSQIHHSAFRVFDKNSKTLGEYCVEKSTSGSSLLHMDVHTEDSEGNDIMESVYLNLSNDGSTVSFHPAKNNKTDLGMSHYKWAKIYSDDVVHTSGDETIAGNKYFTQDVNVKNSDIDIAVTPSNNLFSCFRFRGKGNVTTASIQYSQRTYGVNDICFYVSDADSNSHGFRIRTDNRLEPIENNTYSLGSSSSKWSDFYSTNAYINNTYTNRVTTYSITHPSDNSYSFMCGGSDYDKGATLYLGGVSATNFTPGRFALAARKTDGSSVELAGSPNGTLTWGGKSLAIDDNVVHKSGNETINGIKVFTDTIYKKNSALDLQVNPSSVQYNSFFFTDKNNAVMGYLEHLQTTTGVNAMGLVARDKSNKTHGIQVTSEDNVIPLGNGVVNLGLSGSKWKNVYATTFNGNLKGNADTATKASYLDNYSLPGGNKIYLDWSGQVKGYVGLKVDNTVMGGLITTNNIGSQAAKSATYSTTPATSDNSTKIATTAWVRSYVNSVVGSNTVGSSVSAYWSDSSNVTATGQSSSGGYYPSGYSEYITKTPTVGTIYSGAQLYTVLNTYASATGYQNSNTGIFFTTTTAQATFSIPINPSGKYLCTTANTVRFRAYTARGSTDYVGTSSVVDNSSAKSIFIRVQ